MKQNRKQRSKKIEKGRFQSVFLTSHFSSEGKRKVVYIRPEYHERLLRIVQLANGDKVTLYSYIDKILEHHFAEYGPDIIQFFNSRFKPIL